MNAGILLQHLLPKQALTSLAGVLAGSRGGAATTAAIRAFVSRYGVNMAEAAQSDPAAYPTFNEFFTRALKPGARPLAQADLICPVDGAISQFGSIEGDRIFQAKGHHYTTQALVGGDGALAAHFHGGLFARNERVVCVLDGEAGPWVLVLVGATIVGSMATVWHGVVNPPRPGTVREWAYHDQDIRLAQGQEMGRFLLGSTVVMLFPSAQSGGRHLAFNPAWAPGQPIQLGQPMATCT